jgi:hypothetical protein
MNRATKVSKSRQKNEIALTRGKVPKTRKNFENSVLATAAIASLHDPSLGATGMFEKIQRGLEGTTIDETGAMRVRLVCGLNRTTGDVVEEAIRERLGDKKDADDRPLNVDVMFDGTPIEVKYSKTKFDSLATDSQSLRRRTDKWYMYVRGDISFGVPREFDVWLMRSDALYNAVKAYKGINDDSLEIPTIEEIEGLIDQIKKGLATAIWSKATGLEPPKTGGDEELDADGKKKNEKEEISMGLKRRIGLNRVRFDLKFEGLLRAYVKEILRS